MATAKIVPIGPPELALVVELHNAVFSPACDEELFRRRFQGRRNVTTMVALVEDRHVGLVVGYELTPRTYFCWLCGVVAGFRRQGIATQLMQAQRAWPRITTTS